ncbi:hypothetical protein FBEOM_11311 [Fusarium beomiforme]|uniref:Uncharacterized protein n=1 Tax=Fusarium beomiforme TaxID=44412 RepID=A0A9P5DRU9_9HYPO|nr:hypothetical protein FBEOM_11311 [Fusarium beomiforme]
MKFIYLLNLATLAMAAPKADEKPSLSMFSGVIDTSDPTWQKIWNDAIGFEDGDASEARSVAPALETRACNQKDYHLCLAVWNTGCALSCRCASCFNRAIDQCKRAFGC